MMDIELVLIESWFCKNPTRSLYRKIQLVLHKLCEMKRVNGTIRREKLLFLKILKHCFCL